MNLKSSLWRFVKDGLVGGGVTLIPFAIWTVGMISQWGVPDDFWGSLGFQLFLVGLIGFFSLGIGGRYLDSITTRWSWIKPLLIISIIPWITGVVLFQNRGWLHRQYWLRWT